MHVRWGRVLGASQSYSASSSFSHRHPFLSWSLTYARSQGEKGSQAKLGDGYLGAAETADVAGNQAVPIHSAVSPHYDYAASISIYNLANQKRPTKSFIHVALCSHRPDDWTILYKRAEGSAFYYDVYDALRSLHVGSPRFKKIMGVPLELHTRTRGTEHIGD
jgi:hypothetical protein